MKSLKKQIALLLVVLASMPVYGAMPHVKSCDVQNEDITSVLNRTIRQRNYAHNRMEAPLADDAKNYAYAWGVLNSESGYTWYYTQSVESRGWYMGASEFTVYDNKFNAISTFRIEIPEGMNVNDIEPTGFITTDFFDGDASTLEMPIFIHAVDNGRQINKLGIYRMDGEKIIEYDGYSMLDFNVSDDYHRILMVRYAGENESANNLYIDVLKPSTAAPEIEHTFAVNQDLLLYSDGPCINYFSFEGEPYYTISHYENICMDGYDPETFVPIQVPDNRLTIKTYNADFALVDSVSIKIDPQNPEATYGFATFGLYSNNDLRKGDFTGDKQFNYIVTHYEYFAQSDEYVYHIRTYDSESNLINTIDENVITWFILSDIPGYEQQCAFLKIDETESQYMEMVNIPSCEVAAVFPSVIDGYLISTTLDRCKVDDGYQYAISLSQATVDENGDAIARIGWYKKDCTVDHYVEFNLGKNCEKFTPYIAGYVLNPYLFNTDDKREYLYLAQNKRTDGSEIIDRSLYLADEDGNVLRTIKPDEGDDVNFSSGDVFDYNTDSPCLVLSFYNGEKDAFEIQYFGLPFDTFTSGGDGTAENPYVITTAGQLAQIYKEPAAHYVLGNDIDMSAYIYPYFGAEEFTGTFDGGNYVISNLTLNNCGLFAGTNNATIKNLQLQSPMLNIDAADCGIIANTTNNTTIENVHIYDALLVGSSDAYIGGMVGVANKTTIQIASIKNIDKLSWQFLSYFGCIVGNAVGCEIKAVVVNGEVFTCGDATAGIAAVADSETIIKDCRVAGLLPVEHCTGGIVAYSNSAQISNCFVDCVFDFFVGAEIDFKFGAIVGTLDMQSATDSQYAIANCVTTSDNIVGEVVNGEMPIANNYSGTEYVEDGIYKAVEEMDRAFFEEIGYKYGNTVDAPWMGEGLPLLYFENDYQSVTSVDRDNSAIYYDGVTVWAANATTIALYNMQGVLIDATDSEMLHVGDIAPGVYVVLAIDSNGHSQVRKIVVK